MLARRSTSRNALDVKRPVVQTGRCGQATTSPAAGEVLDDVRDGQCDVTSRVTVRLPEHEESANDEFLEELFGDAYLLAVEHAPAEHAVDALPFSGFADCTFAPTVAPETAEREYDTNDWCNVPPTVANKLQLEEPARVFIH